jgi:hypothetical protein
MVQISLINISLDASTNIAWWMIKTSCKYTLYGTYYLITYFIPPKKTKEEIELIELKNEIIQLNRQLHIINCIHNNSNIIFRQQLKFNDNDNDDIDLQLLDEFVILNDSDNHSDIKTSQ